MVNIMRVLLVAAACLVLSLPALADDSGLEVDALDGAPGVWSARYAGEGATDEENLRKLLSEVPRDGDRRVAYVCALAFAAPRAPTHVVEARCEGTLAEEPRGSGGFGYDPAFVPLDYRDGRTMAELSPGEKDAINLGKLGFVTTTNQGGESVQWKRR